MLTLFPITIALHAASTHALSTKWYSYIQTDNQLPHICIYKGMPDCVKWLQVHKDGSYEAFDIDYMGGKTLMAMCSLLLNTQVLSTLML